MSSETQEVAGEEGEVVIVELARSLVEEGPPKGEVEEELLVRKQMVLMAQRAPKEEVEVEVAHELWEPKTLTKAFAMLVRVVVSFQ